MFVPFADKIGKRKISFALNVNLQAIVIARLEEKVEKEPKKDIVSSSSKDGGSDLVAIEADPIIVIESEESAKSTRLVSRKCLSFCMWYCLLFFLSHLSFTDSW